jgi:hypothetical protein
MAPPTWGAAMGDAIAQAGGASQPPRKVNVDDGVLREPLECLGVGRR